MLVLLLLLLFLPEAVDIDDCGVHVSHMDDLQQMKIVLADVEAAAFILDYLKIFEAFH